MRFSLRSGVNLGVCVAASLALAVSLGVTAYADDDPPVPSTQQVEQARRDVAEKAQSVAQIRADLAAAKGQRDAAELAASIASEEYNGAMWRLSESRKASKVATARLAALRARVVAQGNAMKRLVVQSYQEGTQLNAMTAILDAEGPESVMGRQAVVDMAGDSMAAGLEKFSTLSGQAQVAEKQAKAAVKEQASLARDAEAARSAAIGAVNSAAALEAQISRKRDALVAELARSQNISIGLAKQRQSALEAIADQKAAAAANAKAQAAAKAAEQQRAAKQRAAEAKKAVTKAKRPAEQPESQDSSVPAVPATPPPPVDATPPPAAGGAAAAIAFARQQIGEPYRWGAAGPNSWDCSGLTMMAWSKGGKSLPHYSRAQFTAGTRIALSAVKPGDLYFWSSNGSPSGIHHVAIAIGGGQFIEAPRTGLDVRVNSIGNWFPTYAVRL